MIYIWTGFWSFSRHYLREEPYEPFDVVFCGALTILAFLGLRRAFRERGAATAMPYVIVFLFFPLVYYITHPEDYYRRPIDPMLVILAAYAITSWHRPQTETAAQPFLRQVRSRNVFRDDDLIVQK